MQLKTILNYVHPIKGFVYEAVRFFSAGDRFGLEVKVRTGTKAVCSGCGKRPGYDTLGALAVPIRSVVGTGGVSGVCDASGQLSGVRGDGGAGTVGNWKNVRSRWRWRCFVADGRVG